LIIAPGAKSKRINLSLSEEKYKLLEKLAEGKESSMAGLVIWSFGQLVDYF